MRFPSPANGVERQDESRTGIRAVERDGRNGECLSHEIAEWFAPVARIEIGTRNLTLGDESRGFDFEQIFFPEIGSARPE